MSSQRILNQGASFEALKDIVALVKDPELITKAHELYRKELQLSEAAAMELSEAKGFLAQYSELSAKFKFSQAEFEKTKVEYEKYKEMCNEELRIKADDLNTFAATLNEQFNAQKVTEANLAAAQAKLDGAKEVFDKHMKDEKAALKEREGQIASIKDANEAEASRLERLASDLTIRIERVKLREQAADL